jgi:hypothetical protein
MPAPEVVLSYLQVLIWPVVVLLISCIVFRKQFQALIDDIQSLSLKDWLTLSRGKQGREVAHLNRQGTDALEAEAAMVAELGAEVEASREVAELGAEVEASRETIPAIDADPEPATGEPQEQKLRPSAIGWQRWQGRPMAMPAEPPNLSQYSPQTNIVAAWQDLEAIIRTIYASGPNEPGGSLLDQAAIVVGQLDRAGVLYATAPAVLSAITRLANSRDTVERRFVSNQEATDYTESARTISKLLAEANNRLIEKAARGSR